MTCHSHARPDHPRRPQRRFSPRTAASVLALALGLSACASGSATSPGAQSAAAKSAMLLKIADETNAGGDPATAASLYRQLHEQQPKDPVPLERLAEVFMRMQDYRSAADAYRAALVIEPDNADLHREFATALLVTGDAQTAMVELRAALAKRADDPRLYNLLGVAQDMAGQHDLAQQTYRHGTDIAPANISLRNNHAISLALSGDFADAVAELGQIAGPKAPPRYRLNLALAYGLSGDDVHAAEAAREVLDEASVQNNLAYYALLRGMDQTHRTAAIIGAELHGTPVVADAALKPRTAVAEAAPVAAPTPAAVASSSLPPLLPDAVMPRQTDAAPKPRPVAIAIPDPPAEHADATGLPELPQVADAPMPSPAPRHVFALTKDMAQPDAAALLDALPHDAPSVPQAAAPKPSAPPRHVAALADHPAPAKAPDTTATTSLSPAPAAPETASDRPVSLVPPPPPPPEPAKDATAAASPATQAALAPTPDKPSEPPQAAAPPPAPADQPPADGAGKSDAAPDSSSPVGPSSANSPDETVAAAAAAPADFAMDAEVNAWLDRHTASLSPKPQPKAETADAPQTLHAALERYTVQLGSFLSETSAHRLADAFAAKSVVVTISHASDHDGRNWYVTRAGEFTSMDDATGALHMIQSMGGAEPIVVKHRMPAEPTPAT